MPDSVTAKANVRSLRPHLVLLEWAASTDSGLDFIQWMKRYSSLSQTPVIFLTTRVTEEERVLGLESGAADYVIKPFSGPELLARINAVLRRTNPKHQREVIQASGLGLNTQSETITCCGREVSVGPLEFRLLAFLIAHPERVHSREELLESVWGHPARCEVRTVDVKISRLRDVLHETSCDVYIQTVHGSGYRFSTRRQRS